MCDVNIIKATDSQPTPFLIPSQQQQQQKKYAKLSVHVGGLSGSATRA